MSIPTTATPLHALHLANRITFGPVPGLLVDVQGKGLESYLEEQLTPAPDPWLDKRLAGFEMLRLQVPEVMRIWRGEVKDRSLPSLIDELYLAKLIRCTRSVNQLQEVMVDFWFNHFNVTLPHGFVRQAVAAYERDAIRPHVFGKFRTMLGAVAQHPAMLFYLDNHLNRKDTTVGGRLVKGINENYGRELLELHTVGVTAGYTQDDVVDAARCMTGWTIDDIKMGGRFVYRAEHHDDGQKSVFGLTVPAKGGKKDGELLLDFVASHSATAQFIARKLAQRFVSDDPPQTVVDACAATFLSSDGDLTQVLRTLFTSSEFWGEVAKPKLKTPFEYVISSFRALDVRVRSVQDLVPRLNAMGMPMYGCAPPTGYSSLGREWLSPLYLHRFNFAFDLSYRKIRGVAFGARSEAGVADVVGQTPSAALSLLNRDIFASSLSKRTLETAVESAGGDVSKTVALVLASPEMQGR